MPDGDEGRRLEGDLTEGQGWRGGRQGEGRETVSRRSPDVRVFQPENFQITFPAFAGVSACTACDVQFHEIATGTCARAKYLNSIVRLFRDCSKSANNRDELPAPDRDAVSARVVETK